MTRKAKSPSMPAFIEPMLATAVKKPPVGATWQYEPKLDGHRLQLRKDGDAIRVRTRNGKDPAIDVDPIVAAAEKIHAHRAIIDGEGVALDASGRAVFSGLRRKNDRRYQIAFIAFDLLYLEDELLLSQPLHVRQAQLADVIKDTGIILCAALPGEPDELEKLRAMRFEGVVAKRIDSSYRSGERVTAWQKMRFDLAQEFIIGGYRPQGSDSIDALLVGYYEGKQLRFAAKVVKGLNRFNRRELRQALEPLRSTACPFADLPTHRARSSGRRSSWQTGGVYADEMPAMHWVQPKLLAQIEFLEWTDGDLLRHPGFVGIRRDKAPKSVVRET